MSAAWDIDVPQTEKMVLLCLCDYANDEGECWPSVESLSRKCSVSDRTVQRAIRKLQDMGILKVRQSQGRIANVYAIDLSQPRHSVTPTECHPDTVSPLTPTQCHPNPDTVSPKPSRTIKQPSMSSPDVDDFTFDDFVESWNEVAAAHDLPSLKAPTKARKAAFRQRKREFPQMGQWQAAFRTLRTSKFLHGDNDRGWKANPDFVLQAKTFPKLVEGAYG